MAYIFLDESGNLGFDFSKKKTSKYFVISFLFTRDKIPIEKIVRKIFHGFTTKEKKHHPGVLHAYKELPKTRIKMLKMINKQDLSVISI